MARVKVRITLLRAGIETVVRLRRIRNKVFTVAGVVNRVRPRPRELRVQAAQVAQLPCDLHAVVARAGCGLKLIDDVKSGKGESAGGRIMLVDVAEAEELGD